jgi:hypothetical protein
MYQLIIGVTRENSPPVRLLLFKSSLWDTRSTDDQTLLQSGILQAVSGLDRHIPPPTGALINFARPLAPNTHHRATFVHWATDCRGG